MNVLFTASTLPRFADDMQPPFVLHQAQAWKQKRPDDEITILAPDDILAARAETVGAIEIRRYRYALRRAGQTLAYPAILPNIREHPHRLLQLPGFLIGQYLAARKIIRQRKINMIYAHWVTPQGIVAWLLHKTVGVPYMLQTHSSDLTTLTRLGGLGRRFARVMIRDADHYFCVNRDQADAALALFDDAERAVIEAKLTSLPMGVGEEIRTEEASPAEADEYDHDFAFLGRLSAKKGVDRFVAAAQLVARNSPDLSIAIAGDGELREQLMQVPFSGARHFAGFVTGTDKLDFLARTRFAVFPSLSWGGDVEGLPVALLEALCMGKIVAASRDTNIELLPEWPMLRDLIFLIEDPRDTEAFAATLRAMQALTPPEIKARSRRIKALAERYHWDRLIDDYLAAVA